MIKEIYILNKGGIGLFYQNFSDKIEGDEQLAASLFNVIQTFAETYLNEEVRSIVADNDKLLFFQGDSFSIIIRTDMNSKLDEKSKKLKALRDEFFKRYHKNLKCNITDISIYDDFEETIRNIFKIEKKPKHRSSELLQQFFGIPIKKINLKKLIHSL